MTSTSKPLILIVEDDKALAGLTAEHLELAGMKTQVFHRSANLKRYLETNFVNLMLLDVNLPDGSGFSVLEDLRKSGFDLPTIFFTGNDSEVQKVRGLETGADDYITKPFSFPELVARINAVLRRAETARDNQITPTSRITEKPFVFCGAEVNTQRLEITFPDAVTETLGRKEFGIMAYLYANQGTILTRKNLIHAVWGIHADVKSRSLDQYIVKIRDAFGRHGIKLDAFRTIHGVGYIYDPDASEVMQ
jgi:DNA-binding response OmpR family regulator